MAINGMNAEGVLEPAKVGRHRVTSKTRGETHGSETVRCDLLLRCSPGRGWPDRPGAARTSSGGGENAVVEVAHSGLAGRRLGWAQFLSVARRSVEL
jgi:hypothetical protein